MYYKFPTRRNRKPDFPKLPKESPDDNEEIGLIQGQVPDSKEEWWIAKSLNRIGIPYTYQYPINGGNQRGGYKLDFLVYTVPLATIIEPVGNHWHTGELGADDKKRQADVEFIMQSVARTPITNLWIPDMLDEDTVYNKLLGELT